MDSLKTAAEMLAMVSDAAEQFSVLDLAKARLMAALEQSVGHYASDPTEFYAQRYADVQKTLVDLFRMAEPMTIGSENILFDYGPQDCEVKIVTDKFDVVISILPCVSLIGCLRFPCITIHRQA